MAKLTSLLISGFSSVTAVEQQLPVLSINGSMDTKIITLEEVSWHYHQKDCWIVIYDRVYDITNFLDEHPGGNCVLLEYAGRDASLAFRGTGHSAQAITALDKFFVGELPMEERIFRKPGGFILSNLPE